MSSKLGITHYGKLGNLASREPFQGDHCVEPKDKTHHKGGLVSLPR